MLGVNTILHTKDGRMIGNAIIIAKSGELWTIKTDYGNECTLTLGEIDEQFYIAEPSFNDLASPHKHAVDV